MVNESWLYFAYQTFYVVYWTYFVAYRKFFAAGQLSHDNNNGYIL